MELPPLSEAADEALRRAWALLVSVQQDELRTEVIGLGYTKDIHGQGVWLVSCVAGEQPFWKWREWRVLRPPLDPDMPAEVAQLAAFVQRWQPLAIAAVYQLHLAGDDEQELLSYVTLDREFSSTTWQAKTYGNMLEHLTRVPSDFYQSLGRQLAVQGLDSELATMRATLARVQQHLRDRPVDEDERRDIQAWREDSARELHGWLDARRTQLADLGEELLTLVGLGDVVPPAGPTELLSLVASFAMGAEA